jgi:aspartate/methionine/tyrosine aminotransferase
MVSRRGTRMAGEPPAIAAAHFRCEARPYHPELDPGGYLNLGTAENRLVWDLLEPRLTAPRKLGAADVRYAPLYGGEGLREATAAFLSRTRGVSFAAEDLIVVSGVTAALDIAATALCDPGEAIVVPAPYYGAFDVDLVGRSDARLVPAPLAAATGFRLSAVAIGRAADEARRAGLTVRAIALTSPYNPVGHVYRADELRAVLEVAAERDLDVVVDEIYANSVFGPDPFMGMYGLPGAALPPDRIHTVWGFAKDFGLPGLKVGVLHTVEPRLRAAARELAYFAPVSTDTQALLCSLLADPGWTDAFLATSRRRLAASYAHVTGLLMEHRIDHLPAGAGFSVWTDLRALLPAATHDGEAALWRRLLTSARLSILPGDAFGCAEPGWFRICHTVDPAIVAEGVRRLGSLVGRT